MSEDNKYTVQDLVAFSALQKPVEFSDALNNILLDRISANIEGVKTSIAQSLFNPSHQSADQDEIEYTEDN